MISTTTSSVQNHICINKNETICQIYSNLGVNCNSYSMINNIPYSVYCCATCEKNKYNDNVTSPLQCNDSQDKCAYWINYCSILTRYNPHPCRKTCKLCH